MKTLEKHSLSFLHISHFINVIVYTALIVQEKKVQQNVSTFFLVFGCKWRAIFGFASANSQLASLEILFSPRMADPQTAPTSRVPPSHRGYATECAPNAQAKGGRNAENPGSMRIRKSNHNPKSELICTTPMYSTYPTEKCEAFLEGFLGIWSLPEKNKRSI